MPPLISWPVCVGERLETSVLLVHHLRQWKLPRILVKVTNKEQVEILKLVGATEVIHPEQGSARKAALLIHHYLPSSSAVCRPQR